MIVCVAAGPVCVAAAGPVCVAAGGPLCIPPPLCVPLRHVARKNRI